MSNPGLRLSHAPIVEAVLDLDCDMPPGQDIADLEVPAREGLRDRYPKVRTQFLQGYQIEQPARAEPPFSAHQSIQALQLLQEDEKQLVQVRAHGFSFNRLVPYTSLDDYLPEIERAWRLFVGLASPVQVRAIRLRYINRIPLPSVDDRVEMDDYLKLVPRLPDDDRLSLLGFLNQYTAIEHDTGNRVNIILTTQPRENDVVPIIFDIEAFREEAVAPDDWDSLLARIRSLRGLKNRVFVNTLTQKCLDLFR